MRRVKERGYSCLAHGALRGTRGVGSGDGLAGVAAWGREASERFHAEGGVSWGAHERRSWGCTDFTREEMRALVGGAGALGGK